MNNIIIVNKEKNMTSHDVVNIMRKKFNIKRIGHTGTLDPMATGVLVICLDEATKLVQFLEADSKDYEVEIVIGIGTDTYDSTGNIVATKEVKALDEAVIDNCLNSFLGKSIQEAPIYSALKVNGKKLYDYARSNIDIELPKREIEITAIKRSSNLIFENQSLKFSFQVSASKGTYIRSLCHDIGTKLGYPAMMNHLNRTRSGIFKIEDSYTLSEINNDNYKLINPLFALSDWPKTNDAEAIQKAKNGMKFSKNKIQELFGYLPEKFIIYDGVNLKGIYGLSSEKSFYRALRIWN